MTADTSPELTDQLLGSYCDWRIQCLNVRAAYEHFTVAPADDRALAFAAYQAALDREESAADAYAEQVRQVGRAASAATPHPLHTAVDA
jgi:hypothetical protein